MDAYLALEKDTLNRLEDREFIRWLIEDLDRWQLGVLLLPCDIKLPHTSIEKFPIQFLHNKLIGARKKFIQVKTVPPFPFISVDEADEFTEKKIIKMAKDEKCNLKETALMFFLQNHYQAALKVYDERNMEQNNEKQEVKKETSKEQEDVSPRIEKSLKKKINNLTKEKIELQEQVQQLREELKQRNLTNQKDVNALKRQLADEVNQKEQMNTVNLEMKNELEKEKAEKNHLAAQILVLETKMEKEQKRIALIGNPMNTSILTKKNCQIDIYELEEIDHLIEKWSTYDHLFYLTYTIDEMMYKEVVPDHMQKSIQHIENFRKLKETMGEL